MSAPVVNAAGNAAYVHELKCWAESFDEILFGRKRAEVRVEEDRKFRAGDMLRLTRTDHEGKPTEPRVQLVIEVLHVERHAGPLELRGARIEDGGGVGGALSHLAVLSLSHRFERHTYEAPPK
jgi:hypothetical protein